MGGIGETPPTPCERGEDVGAPTQIHKTAFENEESTTYTSPQEKGVFGNFNEIKG